jgi:hypothetical protein
MGTSADEVMKYFERGVKSDDRSVNEVLEESFKKSIAELGKDLEAAQEMEKRGVLGLHVTHTLEAAVQAAFPGWPEDTRAANHFASNVFVSGGKVTILGGAKSEAMSAIKRFAAVLWPGKPVPDGRLFLLSKWLAKGVKYCTASQIDKYKIELSPSIRRGIAPAEIFDSQTLYNRKVGPQRYVPGSISVANDWTKCRSIWVMILPEDGQPTFYSHIGKLGRFHHSSFKSGGAVMAAGEWVITSGKLKMINACSGHYKPEPWRFAFAANYLKDVGIVSPDTKIEVWRDGTRVLEPCLDFLRNLTGNLTQGYSLYPS